MINKITFPIALSLLMLNSACVSLGTTEAPPAFLVLTAKATSNSDAVNRSSAENSVVVLIPDVPRRIDTNRIPVQINDSSIAYIQGAYWADKPAKLMQELIAETITASTGKLVLDVAQSSGLSKNTISGTLSRFGIDEQELVAIVRYDAVTINAQGEIVKHRFEARRNINMINAIEAGEALNDAANEVAMAITNWVDE